jgi:hypothetical protein
MDSIKKHYLYPLYLEYLSGKNYSKGALELIKISEASFFEFKLKYDTNEVFRNNQENYHKSIIREDKIDNIIDDKLSRN